MLFYLQNGLGMSFSVFHDSNILIIAHLVRRMAGMKDPR